MFTYNTIILNSTYIKNISKKVLNKCAHAIIPESVGNVRKAEIIVPQKNPC